MQTQSLKRLLLDSKEGFTRKKFQHYAPRESYRVVLDVVLDVLHCDIQIWRKCNNRKSKTTEAEAPIVASMFESKEVCHSFTLLNSVGQEFYIALS